MARSKNKPDISQDLDPVEGKRLLEQGAKTLSIELSAYQIEQFMDYLALLVKWNRQINLTGLRSFREILIKHFLDSLTPLPYLPEKASLLDLGTGAGFPGLPIKIVRPHQPVTLIEASSKKVSFLKETVRHLKLGAVPIFLTYLDKGSPPSLETAPFDMVVTRAVGKTIDILMAADSFLKPGGKVLFMKGPGGFGEIYNLKAQIQERGFRLEAPIFLTLPLLGQERTLIFVTKDRG
ncbi:MAG: 16S rRNA (guanine(527)-N(7))-methyltransferase RsmG [Deltaproteobacteria bacterium]|nr:16S rRNA (guanine(527)-N(7))-methyltransferase RsmG [Deltaproteobacteria bacterium]